MRRNEQWLGLTLLIKLEVKLLLKSHHDLNLECNCAQRVYTRMKPRLNSQCQGNQLPSQRTWHQGSPVDKIKSKSITQVEIEFRLRALRLCDWSVGGKSASLEIAAPNPHFLNLSSKLLRDDASDISEHLLLVLGNDELRALATCAAPDLNCVHSQR